MLNLNNVDKEIEKTKKFQEKYEIDNEKIESLYEEIYNELDDDLTEKQKQIRTLRRVRGILRRKIQNQGDKALGLFIARYPNNDYDKYAYKKAEEYVATYGLEQAKIDGYVNDEGRYIHRGAFNKGEIINPKNSKGAAIGLFRNADNEPEPRLVNIASFNINKNVPLGQEIELEYKEANDGGKIFTQNKLWFFNDVDVVNNDMFTEEDLVGYINVINDIFGEEFNSEEIIFEDYDDMIDFAKEHGKNKFNIMGLFGNVIDIGAVKDLEKRIPLTFESDIDSYQFWVEPYIFRDLNIQPGVTGVIFLNAFIKRDDSVGFNVVGFMPLSDEL